MNLTKHAQKCLQENLNLIERHRTKGEYKQMLCFWMRNFKL